MSLNLPDDDFWLGDWQQVSRQLRKELANRLALSGLTEQRAAVLEGLRNHAGPCSQTELASDLSLSDSSLCGLIDRMQQEGLITRSRSPLDRRKFLLTLTPSGLEREADVGRIRAELRREIERQLPAGTIPALIQLLQALTSSLDLLMTDAPASDRRMAS